MALLFFLAIVVRSSAATVAIIGVGIVVCRCLSPLYDPRYQAVGQIADAPVSVRLA